MTWKLAWTLMTLFALVLFVTAPASAQDAVDSHDSAVIAKVLEPDDKASDEKEGNTAEVKEDAQSKESEESDEVNDDKQGDEEKKQGAEKKEEKKQDKKPARKTLKIEGKPLKIEVTISGDLVSRDMTRIELDAESWNKWKIDEIVPHGARVRVGETLVRFDGEELNEALAKMELDQRLGELSLMKAERELPLLEEALDRQLKNAQRSWEEAQEDYSRYTDEERDLIVKQYQMRLKQSKFNLDYVKDELEQLQKMYEADDLTEETEEMILRRQKTQYEFAKFSYEIAKYSNALTLDVYLPRSDEREKEGQRLVELALERAKTASELDLAKARYRLEKARRDREEAIEKHSELIADKGCLTIKSPASGVVYYGKCANGKWGEVVNLKQKLLPDKSVPKGTVMMTIVNPAKVFLYGALDEKDLPSVKEGQSVEVELAADGVEPIDAKVASIAYAPTTRGRFEIEFDLTGDKPDWLVPGMTGKAKVVTYEKKKALMVPKEAVHEDEDSGRKYVWEVEEEDDEVEVEKEWVETGKSKDKEIEITSGLEAGDVISLDPDEKGTDDHDDDHDEEEDEEEDDDDES